MQLTNDVDARQTHKLSVVPGGTQEVVHTLGSWGGHGC